MNKTILKSLLLVFVVLMVFAQVLTGCGKKGHVSGSIYEAGTEELVIGKVIVTIGGQSITVNNGVYSVKDVPVGTQTLKVQAEGYKVYTASVKINGGKTTEHNVNLKKELVFAYVAIGSPPGNDLYTYTVNTVSGGFTSIIGSPFSQAENIYPNDLLSDAEGKFLYVSNSGPVDNVYAFTIDPNTGYLAPISGSPFATNESPEKLAMCPGGGWFAVGGRALDIFTRDQNSGVLSDRKTFTFATGDGEYAKAVIFNKTGDYLYVAVSTGYIYAYSKNPDGTFSKMTNSPLATCQNPSSLAFGPDEKFLYVSSAGSTAMKYYSVNNDGSLGTESTIYLNGQSAVGMIFNGILYTANGFDILESRKINPDGTVSRIGSPITFGNNITTLAVDPFGKRLYVNAFAGGNIWILDINSDGTLSHPADNLIESVYYVKALTLVKPAQ